MALAVVNFVEQINQDRTYLQDLLYSSRMTQLSLHMDSRYYLTASFQEQTCLKDFRPFIKLEYSIICLCSSQNVIVNNTLLIHLFIVIYYQISRANLF